MPGPDDAQTEARTVRSLKTGNMKEQSFLHWLTDYKIPLGRLGGRISFDWLQMHGGWFFDGLAEVMGWLIDQLLVGPAGAGPDRRSPSIVTAISYWLQRNWKVSLLRLSRLPVHRQPGLLGGNHGKPGAGDLVLSSSAWRSAFRSAFYAAHRPRLYQVLQPVLDLMQTLPPFVYLIPAIVFFGIGMVPGLLATVIFVVAAPIRLTYLGVSSVPKPLLEAADAFGGTPWQKLTKVELHHALPQIMAGLNQTIMLSLSMVVVAALVGADGLGVPVVRALNQVNPSLGFESGFVIVVLAIILDRVMKIGRAK